MPDTPGQLLSCLPPSHKPRSKISAFFLHLFRPSPRLHSKPPFPRKLLPPDRPKQSSHNHHDEKLPMAKMLLIADENRGGFPGSCTGECTKDDKSSHRKPGVVARLMGLETMPAAPSESKESETDMKEVEARSSLDLLREYVTNSDHNGRHTGTRSFKGKPIGLDMKPLERYPSRQNAEVAKRSSSKNQDEAQSNHSRALKRRVPNLADNPKSIIFSRLSSLPPYQTDAPFPSILSPSKSHNKLVSPINSPLSPKNAVRLFEAATKILEPSMHPSPRARMHSPVSRSLLGDADREEEDGRRNTCPKSVSSNSDRNRKGEALSKNLGEETEDKKKQRAMKVISPPLNSTTADQAAGSRQDGAKTQGRLKKSGNVGDMRFEPRNGQEHASRLQVREVPVSSSREDLQERVIVREEATQISSGQRHGTSKNLKEGRSSSKCNHGHRDLAQSGAEKEGRIKPDVRKQEQTSRRLSQPAGMKFQNLKQSEIKQRREPSPPKGKAILYENVHINATSLSCGRSSPSSKSLSENTSESIISSSVSSKNNSSCSNTGMPNSSISHKVGRVGTDKTDIAHREDNSSIVKSLPRRKATSMDISAEDLKSVKQKNRQSLSASVSQKQKSTTKQDQFLMPKDGFCSEDESSSSAMSGLQIKGETDSVEGAAIVKSPGEHTIEMRTVENNTISRERVRAKWQIAKSSIMEILSSESIITEITTQSSLGSSSPDFGDTASSHVDTEETASSHVDADASSSESVSYAGKPTMVILQELLMALSSSRSQLKVEGRLGEKFEGSRAITSSDCHPSESALCTQLDATGDNTKYGREHGCYNAAIMDSFLQETKEISSASLLRPVEEESSLGACESVSESQATEECWQPSPISILESPFQDESSNLSDSFESVQDRRKNDVLDDGKSYCADPNCNQIEDGDTADSTSITDSVSCNHRNEKGKDLIESEERHIKDASSSSSGDYDDSTALQLIGPVIDPSIFDELKEQIQNWGLRIGCASVRPGGDDVATSRCGAEIEEEEAATMQMRKLVVDCTNEALRLSLGGVESNWVCVDSIRATTTVASKVRKQVEDWKRMGNSMNIDERVEKEMEERSDFGREIAEMAMEMEANILRSLIEELVGEVSSSSSNNCCRVPTKWKMGLEGLC